MPQIVRVHLALLTVSSIYGIFYVIIKLLLKELGQAELILMRFAMTALLAMAIEFLSGRSILKDFKLLLRVLGTGLVGVFLVQIFLIMGVSLTTTFHSALIMAMVPILTLAFGILMGREHFNKQRMIGIVLAFAGVAVLLLSNPHNTPLPPTYALGDMMVLVAACAFSWFLLASQSLLKDVGSFSMMAYSYLFSALAFGALFWMGAFAGHHEVSYSFLDNLSLNGWLLLFYVVVFASIGTYTLNNFALKHTKASVVSAYIFIQPVLTAFLGLWILHEAFYWDMLIAAGMTFSGVMIATTSPDEPIKPLPMPQEPV